jgi:hypothetical protein
MTKRREWPTSAAEARDRSAEEALRGVKLLRPLVNGRQQFDQTEMLRRQAGALDALQTILRFLESVGAKTRPE